MMPLVTKLIRKQVGKATYAQGIARHSLAEIEELGISYVNALSDWLADKPYFQGEKPRSIDATTLALIWSFLEVPFTNRVKDAVRSKPNLVAYCDRLRTQYFKS